MTLHLVRQENIIKMIELDKPTTMNYYVNPLQVGEKIFIGDTVFNFYIDINQLLEDTLKKFLQTKVSIDIKNSQEI